MDRGADVDRLDLDTVGVQAREVDQILDQGEQVAPAGHDLIDAVPLGLAELIAREQLPESENRVQRGPELVAGAGQHHGVGEHVLLSSKRTESVSSCSPALVLDSSEAAAMCERLPGRGQIRARIAAPEMKESRRTREWVEERRGRRRL